MAGSGNISNKNMRRIQKLSAGIQNTMDDLYKGTYYSSPRVKKDLRNLAQSINSNIDAITNNNMNTVGMPNISKLYSRMDGSKRGNGFVDSVAQLFEDNTLMDDLYTSFMENKFLKDLDMEIDTVCKYMPRLEEALDTKKDNVLSADHFNKDFINVSKKNSGAADNDTTFIERVADMKKRYNLLDTVEEAYWNASKYGEQFIYIVPYEKAFAKLLSNKPNTSLSAIRMEGSKMTLTSFDNKEGKIITESNDCFFVNNEVVKGKPKEVKTPFLDGDQKFQLQLEFNESGIIDSLVQNYTAANDKINAFKESSVWFSEATNNSKLDVSGSLSFDNVDNERAYKAFDGLIQPGQTGNDTGGKINVPGCIVKLITDRSNVIPIYIDDICMGYYYIEYKAANTAEEHMGYSGLLGDPTSNAKLNGNMLNTIDNDKQDTMIRYLSSQLSNFIDTKFVNNNQDLRKELYMILKHNDVFNAPCVDRIKVTFVHPEDMIHVHFRKDPITHRGISDLDRSLIPAKIYSSLYVTNSIAVLTRGQDKRVYYVKQTVESNIAKTLLNVIQQIKQSNFNIRQFQNINSVLNITGRFNDYVIPTNGSGDAPVQMEVLPGQSIDVKTDLMNILEEMAINTTDVPLDIIQSRQSADFATQLTMSNSKFLRKVFTRQGKFQPFLTYLISRIYSAEYGEDIELEVTLPPPMFLNITNTNQIIDNTKNFVNSIIEFELADETDDLVKAIYTRNLTRHYLGTYIDMSMHKQILAKSKLEAELKRSDQEE